MTHEEREARLSAVFASYREAFPDPDPSPAFMPGLWERIEARQSYTYGFKRLAQAIITAALAASVLMGVYLTRPDTGFSTVSPTYLELLAADQNHDSIADAEIVQAVHERR
jgi:hypothetical protein